MVILQLLESAFTSCSYSAYMKHQRIRILCYSNDSSGYGYGPKVGICPFERSKLLGDAHDRNKPDPTAMSADIYTMCSS